MSEARTGKRFDLKLPIVIKESDSADLLQGTTDNLSVAGVYLRAGAEFHVGSKVTFEITLPAEVTGGKNDVKLQCRGTVVRVDEPDNGEASNGVACVIDGYEFVRS